jgi:hypothetical protein
MKLAKKNKAPVIVAKLDRLSRDVHFISGLMVHKTQFIVTELVPMWTRSCCTFTPRSLRRSAG